MSKRPLIGLDDVQNEILRGAHHAEIMRQQEIIKVLIAACEFALMGYRNILEFNLMPGQEEDTKAQIDKLQAAISEAKGQVFDVEK